MPINRKSGGILDSIVTAKRQELLKDKSEVSFKEIQCLAARAREPRSFTNALTKDTVGLIAEIKRASPSKGDLAPDLSCAELASIYEANGAACCSVLTDPRFKGALEDLRVVCTSVGIPVLRKDFIFDEYQIFQARAAGADAVLLIAGVIRDTERLRVLHELAVSMGMSALVEVDNSGDILMALSAGASLLGINNRNLTTFEIDRTTTAKLRPVIPSHLPVVSESGIESRQHVRQMAAYGVQGVLVGEALVTADDPGAKVRELSGVSTNRSYGGESNVHGSC